MQIVKRLIKKILYVICSPFFPGFVQKQIVLDSANRYNMVLEENEKYYTRLYRFYINERIKRVYGEKKIRILDVGCGHGRLSFALAELGHSLDGIDFSSDAIRLATELATKRKISNVNFRVCDIADSSFKDIIEKYDCIICTEVLYMVREYEEVLSEMCLKLKPQGLLFVTFRDKLFMILHSLQNIRFREVKYILDHSEGVMRGTYLNWHTKDQVAHLLDMCGLQEIEVNGIGICSGIEGDPYAKIIQPSTLSLDEQSILMEAESSLAQEYAGCGRYLLVSAIKH